MEGAKVQIWAGKGVTIVVLMGVTGEETFSYSLKLQTSVILFWVNLMFLYCRTAITKSYKLGGLKQQMFILAVLATTIPKPRYGQAHPLTKGFKKSPSLSLPNFLKSPGF